MEVFIHSPASYRELVIGRAKDFKPIKPWLVKTNIMLYLICGSSYVLNANASEGDGKSLVFILHPPPLYP